MTNKATRTKPPGSGRKRGTPNKLNANVKAAIEEAFQRAGGVEYLVKLAKDDKRTFAMLLGKLIPMQLSGDPENPLFPPKIEIVIVDPKKPQPAPGHVPHGTAQSAPLHQRH
jgi:hypothetical protein